MKKIVVLGSLNVDLTMQVARLPKIGETIHGKSIDYLIGGKGANQAVAASRVTDGVALVGCVGEDTFGEKILKHLAGENLDLKKVRKEEAIFTGMASIFKTPTDNSIVVIPGANEWCTNEVVEACASYIEAADILLMQLEIPIKTVKYAARLARKSSTKVILNPAPYYALDNELLEHIDYITPNDSEFESLCETTFSSSEELEKAMLNWQKKHPATRLIVTRGEEGSSYVAEGKIVTKSPRKVQVTDTTGAGDTFNGILAAKLAEGLLLDEAISWANAGAALSIQKFGAQGGMPTAEELTAYH